MNEIYSFIDKIAKKIDLSEAEASRLIQITLLGGASPTQIAAILMGLHVKGETISEIYGTYQTLIKKLGKHNLDYDIFDICGTGSYSSNNLNVSTAVAIVLAGAGVKVAKHIDKTSSSISNSTDVLKSLGVNVNASFALSMQALEKANISFTTSPNYFHVMREIIPIIKDLNIKNIFNLVGPLVNSVQCTHRLIGAYDRDIAVKLAEILLKIGVKKAWVVCGNDNIDEISITGETFIAEIHNNNIKTMVLDPKELDINLFDGKETYVNDLEGLDATYNANRLYNLLKGEKDSFRDIVLLNCAAGFIINDKCVSLGDGIALAEKTIDSGDAYNALCKLVEITNQDI